MRMQKMQKIENILKKCLKCTNFGEFNGFGSSAKSLYCRDCFIKMVRHKFDYALGKNRVFNYTQSTEAILVYDPFKAESASVFLLSVFRTTILDKQSKNHRVIPHVLVILSKIDDSVKKLRTNIQEYLMEFDLNWKMHFVHVSSILSTESDSDPEKETEYNTLMKAIPSKSVRVEVERLLYFHLLIKIAKKLHIEKVILPDNSEMLANASFSALCFGRGSSIRNIASIIDEDFTGVKLIRPLRNISIKEIELVNELQTTTKLYKNRTVSISRNEPQSCIQSICKHFLGGLQDGGFVSTIDTILSSSSKVDSRRKNDTKCRFCFADYLQEEEEFTVKFCPPCSTLLSELTDTIKNRIVCLI